MGVGARRNSRRRIGPAGALVPRTLVRSASAVCGRRHQAFPANFRGVSARRDRARARVTSDAFFDHQTRVRRTSSSRVRLDMRVHASRDRTRCAVRGTSAIRARRALACTLSAGALTVALALADQLRHGVASGLRLRPCARGGVGETSRLEPREAQLAAARQGRAVRTQRVLAVSECLLPEHAPIVEATALASAAGVAKGGRAPAARHAGGPDQRRPRGLGTLRGGMAARHLLLER